MSWLARSIADSLRIDGDENSATTSHNHLQTKVAKNEDEVEEEDREGRGVREDISEFKETLTRQLLGVASFLAPPPTPRKTPSLDRIDRAVSDLDHWGNPDQSSNEVVSEMLKMDSNFPPLEQEDEIGDAVGITEEVLAFAMNIAHHPETWLDFPLEEGDDVDELDISNAQHKHMLVIQRLAPRLAALRIELCPAHMSEGYFWKVYFVLLHSRLQKHDAELLSTPETVVAKALWMQELHKRTKTETVCSKESANRWNNLWEESFDNPPSASGRNMDFVEKKSSIIEDERVIKTRDMDFVGGPSFKAPIHNFDCEDDEDDEWLKEDSDLDGYSGTTVVLGNDEDVSFSDLEEDDDCTTITLKSK